MFCLFLSYENFLFLFLRLFYFSNRKRKTIQNDHRELAVFWQIVFYVFIDVRYVAIRCTSEGDT